MSGLPGGGHRVVNSKPLCSFYMDNANVILSDSGCKRGVFNTYTPFIRIWRACTQICAGCRRSSDDAPLCGQWDCQTGHILEVIAVIFVKFSELH